MESAKLLYAIIDTAIDGIITIDNRGRIESMNPSARKIFGYTEEELKGKNISVLMPEPDQSRHDGFYLIIIIPVRKKLSVRVGRLEV